MEWGGKREGSGRPKGSTGSYKEIKKDCIISIRITKEEKAILEKKAAEHNLSLSHYIHQKITD